MAEALQRSFCPDACWSEQRFSAVLMRYFLQLSLRPEVPDPVMEVLISALPTVSLAAYVPHKCLEYAGAVKQTGALCNHTAEEPHWEP